MMNLAAQEMNEFPAMRGKKKTQDKQIDRLCCRTRAPRRAGLRGTRGRPTRTQSWPLWSNFGAGMTYPPSDARACRSTQFWGSSIGFQ